MDYIHRPYLPGETIAAISTPPGEGGISIIRLSGSRAVEIANVLFSGKVTSYKSHTLHFGVIYDQEGNRLDEALLLLMRAPRSYTGEDIVELQCHGGMIASRKVLEACLAAGARAALPGEFTFKAFMNGKLDLAQAEAVQKLICAKNEESFAAASSHLEGALSKKIRSFQQKLTNLAAILEAWVDFPEEGLEFATQEEMDRELSELSRAMHKLLNSFEDGKKIEQGISLCIVGAPNAGKSSLMNALLNEERAIVTPIPGTTRDLLHGQMKIGQLHFNVTDTAGIRETPEEVEQEGIRRAKAMINQADFVLLVVDASQKFELAQSSLVDLPKDKTVLVWNKIDLPCLCADLPSFIHESKVSAKNGEGIEELRESLNKLVWQRGTAPKDEVLISSVRHKEALKEAVDNVESVILGLKQHISCEFLAFELRSALNALGRIIGTNVTEEILSSIFSQFCIGK